MGTCLTSPRTIRKTKDTCSIIQNKLSPSEVTILRLLYKDLAERVDSHKINLENFLLFFHKNGYWGERLFKQFDYDQTNLISEDEFIIGITKIFKSSEGEKINLLFKFFSKSGEVIEGIYFQQFLVMLYNYPKQDLKEILDDQQFFELQLKDMIVKAKNVSKNKNDCIYRLESDSKVRQYLSQTDNYLEFPEPLPSSRFSSQLSKTLAYKYNMNQSILKFHNGNDVIEVKTTSIQRLVKRFALQVFKQLNINVKTGQLNFQQFSFWIKRHPRLYQNYYEGFHHHVWETNILERKPGYLVANCEKRSEAKATINEVIINIRVHLYHSILIFSDIDEQNFPLATICLDGLAVKKIFDIYNGFGISLTHRDGIYRQKRIFFKNQGEQNEWINLLKYYDGQTVQQKYQIGQKIGTGKFSVVYKSRNIAEDKQYAMKVIDTYKLSPNVKLLLAHESSIMQIVSHPLLVEFKQCILTKTQVYLVTELIYGKDLFEYVKEYQHLSQHQAAKICLQLIIGINCLHSFGIVHRDLKPQNIMVVLDNDKQISYIKIIDFGFSDYINKLSQKNPQSLLTGTPNYIAPQILKQEGISVKIDNFAIGSILYYMLTGKLAFDDHTVTGILLKTMNEQFKFPKNTLISDECKDLVENLLKSNVEERISLEQAVNHPWFNMIKNERKISISTISK